MKQNWNSKNNSQSIDLDEYVKVIPWGKYKLSNLFSRHN